MQFGHDRHSRVVADLDARIEDRQSAGEGCAWRQGPGQVRVREKGDTCYGARVVTIVKVYRPTGGGQGSDETGIGGAGGADGVGNCHP